MVQLRKFKQTDLDEYEYWKLPHHEYHTLNGPYFRKDSVEEVKKYVDQLKTKFNNHESVLENRRLITDNEHNFTGEVSWYWKSEETYWLEIGIVIFNHTFWKQGIGYKALRLWIDEIFKEKEEIVRLGLSTWSGNSGMIKLAKKLGMRKEAEYRKARIVQGKYFDSVSYGILREEWKIIGSNKQTQPKKC